MGEIIDDYFVALERFGRPIGPFEKGRDRNCVYRATATAKRGPKVGNQEDDPLVPPERWWDQ